MRSVALTAMAGLVHSRAVEVEQAHPHPSPTDGVVYVRASVGETRKEAREVDVLLSTETTDSHGTSLRNWKLDRYHGAVLWAHQRAAIPIATGKAKVTGSKARGDRALVGTAKFPDPGKYDLADQVFDALSDGRLRAASVGFSGGTWLEEVDAEGKRRYAVDGPSLVEFSFVPVGSNHEAVVQQIRALGIKVESPTNEPPPAAERGPTMDGAAVIKLAVLARALSLPETATEAEAVSHVAELQRQNADLIRSTGATTYDGAMGAMLTMKESAERATKLDADLAAEKERAATIESDALLGKLKAGKIRITPAQEEKLWPTYTIEQKRAFEATAPEVTIVAAAGASQEPATTRDASTGGAVRPERDRIRHDGKLFEHLPHIVKHRLFKDDHDRYEELKRDWEAAGRPAHVIPKE